MTRFLDKSGKPISAAEFCKGRQDVPKRWADQAKAERPAPKESKKKELTDANADSK